MARVAMVVSTVGYHWEEVFGAYREFKKAGFEIDLFTINGARPKPDPVSLKRTGPLSMLGLGICGSIAPETVLGREIQSRLDQARALSAWDTNSTDILYLPGGHGCLFDMNRDPELHARIARVYERGGVLSAVCHATSTFAFVQSGGAPIARGKRLTGFPHALDSVLVAVGAVHREFLPIPFSNDEALKGSGARVSAANRLIAAAFPAYTRVDSPFVTGMGPKAAGSVARKAVALHRARQLPPPGIRGS